MESRIGLEIIEVVEQAAIASAKLTGKGDKDGADEAAVEAMRERMNKIDMRGRIVIGEGERDDAPMLFIGEEVGTGHKTGTGPEIDIAVDPCEGPSCCSDNPRCFAHKLQSISGDGNSSKLNSRSIMPSVVSLL